ncbi:MAG: hypothetical protein XU08_C0001G0028 [candidate division WWE3 bacterium CSP1-7]|uniref:Uncharacterized protein n=1 Tax=candidate division WWE3 bacterium CSP1-7 TaxID=1576480 RepID=A0A0T5ZY34_UNCKA|nr:MAG: hypothetical protein XU08_C0001G0028 [candidate division WWE3 bacterium CSP1-7]
MSVCPAACGAPKLQGSLLSTREKSASRLISPSFFVQPSEAKTAHTLLFFQITYNQSYCLAAGLDCCRHVSCAPSLTALGSSWGAPKTRATRPPEPSGYRARAENLRLKTLPSGKSPRPARCPQAEDGIIAREDLPLHELFFVLQTEKQLFSYFAFGYNHIWNIIPTT